MTCSAVRCPHCDSVPIVTRGQTPRGTPRYLGQHTACARGSVLRDDRHRGCVPEVRPPLIARRRQARGVRDPARGLRIRTATGLRELHQSEAARAGGHPTRLRPSTPADIAVPLERAGDAEMDDMGRVGGQTQAQRGVWPAMDHRTGAVVASGVGRRQDEVCGRWQARREPVRITRDQTAPGGAYARHGDADEPTPGQRHPHTIERHQWPWRTRMTRVVRTTSGVSNATPMHAIGMGGLVTRAACGRAVSTWPSPLLEHYQPTILGPCQQACGANHRQSPHNRNDSYDPFI
jgi:IS1 family transposase/transposase-like protein